MDNITIACQLNKGEKTVIKQVTGIYDKYQEWRGFRNGIEINRTGLVAEFKVYFALEGG